MKTCPQCQQIYTDDYSFCLTDGAPLTPGPPQSEVPTVVVPRKAPTKRVSNVLVYILAGLLSLSLGVTAAVLYFFWPRGVPVSQVNDDRGQPTATPTLTATPSPTQTVAPSPTPTATRSPEREHDDPPQTRITFERGSIESSVSGRVANERSFVLRALEGQRLSATVTSNDDCVSFENDSQRISYMTTAGDNFLTILNDCDGPARFDLTIRIQ